MFDMAVPFSQGGFVVAAGFAASGSTERAESRQRTRQLARRGGVFTATGTLA
jgi:hypothetical protein